MGSVEILANSRHAAFSSPSRLTVVSGSGGEDCGVALLVAGLV